MSTIKQIAHLAGVSRGTVDRVLNKRGSVNPQTAAKIREIARALQYTPNRPAKTLAVKKKKLIFGYVLFGETESNPFFGDLVAAIRRKADELEEYGVTVQIRHTALDEPEKQAQLMRELVAQGAAGIAITPINHPLVADEIARLTALGIPVVTVNSDIPGSGRVAYVGSDYFKSGETAAGLMALVTGGSANVGVVIGSELVLCHSERVAGFCSYAKENYPHMRIVATTKNNDDDLESYAVTRRLLKQHPEIDALFLASAGVKGSCKAVQELGAKVKILCHDAGEFTCEMLRQGVVVATLCQQPEVQGEKPLDILLDLLGMGTSPASTCYHTNIEIKIRENV